MMLDHLIDTHAGFSSKVVKVKGTVLLMKKNVFDFKDIHASVRDDIKEVLGNKVTLQLISAEATDPEKGADAKLGIPAHLENWITTTSPLTAGECAYSVTFDYEEGFGYAGAFIIRNNHHSEFHLKSLTLDDVPGYGSVHFACNSWVYPVKYYKKDRVFFSNKTYLPSETPAPLRRYREEELVSLRGTGEGELKEWDRVYDYALYNDVSDSKNPRPVLGGSAEYPYPRRQRTSRKPSEEDPNCETRLPIASTLDIYVPRDERFGHLKQSDAFAYGLKAIFQAIQPVRDSVFHETPNEFDSFEDVHKIYEKGVDFPGSSILDNIMKKIPSQLIKETFRKDSDKLFQFPTPQIIKEDKSAWRSDEEFAREMLAGLNPVIIQLLQEFPIKSKLDRGIYGDQNSTISQGQIEDNLDSLTIVEALRENRLFVLDHHDTLMPFLRRINATSTKTYASRTLFFLKDDGTLKPLAIELSLPHPDGDEFGAISEVYTPAEQGVENSLWQLAKAYVAVNDSGHHQLISHWLHTHATIEPFVIATNRQLSVLHPVYKLLQPHYHGTMNINALSRQTLINGGGLLEATVFTAKYSLETSSFMYKHHWVFTNQALPADLKKRGMAVDDPNSPHGLRLLIKDYPYAVDGLEIWSAIQTWVTDYIRVYYKTDDSVQTDNELQSWWKEVREEGHGDKKDETWWPNLQTRDELIESCTTIIWIASALHAAVNFGQYPYGGFLPNRPSISRRFIPKRGSPEFEELESNPDKVFLKTITARLQTLLGISIIEILSMHSSDEVYIGQRESSEWTDDSEALDAFVRFGKRLEEIEENIKERNKDEGLKNRVGPVNMPYTLMIPTSEAGLTGKGIPNSIAI